MTASRRSQMFKPGYEGAVVDASLRPREISAFKAQKAGLITRLHRAMLTLTVLEAHNLGGGSSMPAYLHERIDHGAFDKDPPKKLFRPEGHDLDGFLETMKLLDGLSPTYSKVLFLRASGEFFGGWSFEDIGTRWRKSGQWALDVYNAVIIQAARRSGLLDDVPADYALVLSETRYSDAPIMTQLVTAKDPKQHLYNLRGANPFGVSECVAFWVSGAPVAQRLVRDVRAALVGRDATATWWRLDLDEVSDAVIASATRNGVAWELESIKTPETKRDRWTPDDGLPFLSISELRDGYLHLPRPTSEPIPEPRARRKKR